MQGAAGVTMMAWVSVNADFVCPNTRAVMGKGWDYSAGLWCQDAAVPAPGLAGEVRVSGAQSWGYPGESTIERNKWMLLAVTWDHQQVRHYVNGVPVRPFTDPGAFDDHDPTFAIGCMVTQWFTPGQRIYPFIGTIDEATLYRRPLSDAEIATYYAAADPCVYSALPIADDFNSCTEDSCDPSVGPVHAPTNEGTSCDDGNTCTTADKCHVGVCQPGPATACAGTGHYYAPLVDLGALNATLQQPMSFVLGMPAIVQADWLAPPSSPMMAVGVEGECGHSGIRTPEAWSASNRRCWAVPGARCIGGWRSTRLAL